LWVGCWFCVDERHKGDMWGYERHLPPYHFAASHQQRPLPPGQVVIESITKITRRRCPSRKFWSPFSSCIA
jgi:hypothetical protein